MNYAPSPPETFGVAGLAAGSPEAWNLAYLSHPYEHGLPTSPTFGVHVRRTLQFNLHTADVDLTGRSPEGETIVPWLRLPAPRFVKLLSDLPIDLVARMPLAGVYGVYGWLDLMRQRSHLYREPHDPAHDVPVTSTAEARALLAKIR